MNDVPRVDDDDPRYSPPLVISMEHGNPVWCLWCKAEWTRLPDAVGHRCEPPGVP